ncbi:hypothetical protein K492DRAFT_27014 [Lichtheimia hyalospora FSU 10163]|nr:hypothetical protein K492DRAFT_27014 [Lichtheimia hyalospora FSU 10163]
MSTQQAFPDSWFFIKHQNGYVLTASQETEGSHVVISTLNANSPDTQLWRYDEKGLLVNKKTGYSMEIHQGNAKTGTEIVQSSSKAENEVHQQFSLTEDGRICLKKDQSLVLGIKESFFSRREGLRAHLQSADKPGKEQQWSFVVPVIKTTTTQETHVIKKSSNDNNNNNDEQRDVSEQKDQHSFSLPVGTFPSTPFLLKAQEGEGLFMGVDADKEGGRVVVGALRQTEEEYEYQLWMYDQSTGHLINKRSGLVLGAEQLEEHAHVCQTSRRDACDKQVWGLSESNEIYLKKDASWVLGTKEQDGVSYIHVQKKSSVVSQRFSIALPVVKKQTIVRRWGIFPEGEILIRINAGAEKLALSVDKETHAVSLAPLNLQDIQSQLWRYEQDESVLVHVQTGLVLDGDDVKQLHVRTKSSEAKNTQTWALTPSCEIHLRSNECMVIGVSSEKEASTSGAVIGLHEVRSTTAVESGKQVSTLESHDWLRWSFGKAVVEKTTTTTTSSTTQQPTNDQHQHHQCTDHCVAIEERHEAVTHSPHQVHAATAVHENKSSNTVSYLKATATTTVILTIVRAWRVTFTQRIQQCKTKEEVKAVVEQSRADLEQRLEKHSKRVSSSHEEWSSSVTRVKETMRTQLFDQVISKVNESSSETVSMDEIKSLTDHTCTAIETHVKETKEEEQVVDTHTAKEAVLVAVASIHVTYRYWLKNVQHKITEARDKGASEQEIDTIMQEAHTQLKTEIEQSRTSIKESKSWQVIQSGTQQSVISSFDRIESMVQQEMHVVTSDKIYTSEERFTSWITQTEEKLSTELDTCQHKIQQQHEKENQHDDEKGATTEVVEEQAAVHLVSSKLTETKTQITVWYKKLVEEITATYASTTTVVKDDVLVIIDAAQVDLDELIEQTKHAIHQQSSHLSAATRRQFEYSIETIRTTILASIVRFKKCVDVEQISHESVHKYFELAFGSVAGLHLVGKIDHVVHKVQGGSSSSSKKEDKTSTSVEHKKQESHHIVKITEEAHAITFIEETSTSVTHWFSSLKGHIASKQSSRQETEQLLITSEQELVVTFENAKSKIASSNIERREYYIDVIETLRITALERFTEIKQTTLVEQVSNVTERIDMVIEAFKKQVTVHLDAAKKGEHVITHHDQQQQPKQEEKHKESHHSIGSAIAAGAAVAVGAGAVAAIVHHQKHKNDSQGGGHVEHKPSQDKSHEEKHEQEHHEEKHEQEHKSQVEYHQHHEKISHDIVKTGTVVVVVEHVKTTITTRLEELVEEVRVSIEKGHAKTAESIETIVSKATASIKEELKHICSQAEHNDKCKSEQEKKQLVSAITWAITLITEITIQIQTIYVKAISSSTEITESTKQSVTEIIESTKTKIHTEFEKCHKEISHEHQDKSSSSKNQDKSSSKHLVEIEVTEYTITRIRYHFTTIIEEICVHIVNGKSEHDVKELVAKLKKTLESELEIIITKIKDVKGSQAAIDTINWAKSMIEQCIVTIEAMAVQFVAAHSKDKKVIYEQMIAHVEAVIVQIQTALERCGASFKIHTGNEQTHESKECVSKHKESKEKECKDKKPSDDHKDKSSSKHLVEIEVTEYTITRIRYHFTTIIEEICVHIVNGKSEHDVKELVAKLKKTLESELEIIITKIKDVKGSHAAIDTINWAKGMIEQCIVTIEAMAVQFVAAHSKDKKVIYEQMIAHVEAIIVQIQTALERCGASFKIHTGDGKKVDSGSAKHEEDKSYGSSKNVVTVEVTEYTVTHIRYCFTTIIEEICVYVVKGKSESDVKSLVSKLRKTLEGALEVIITKVKHCGHGEKQQLVDLIAWAKGMIEQAIVQIEAMAIQAVAGHSKDKDAIYEQMTAHVEAILVQIKTALERFESSSIKIEVDKNEATKVVEHKECKKSTEKKKTGGKKKDSSCDKKQGTKKTCGSGKSTSGTKKTSGSGKSTSGTMEITEYTITRIHLCFTTVIEKITVCVVKGKSSSEISKLIATAKKSIESELSVAIKKVKGYGCSRSCSN